VGDFVPWIGPRPEFAGLVGFFQVTANGDVVQRSDIESLGLTDAFLEFVCFLNVFGRLARLSQTDIRGSEPGMGQCEIRVEFNSTLEIWNGFDFA
jgi:hypothetical protein